MKDIKTKVSIRKYIKQKDKGAILKNSIKRYDIHKKTELYHHKTESNKKNAISKSNRIKHDCHHNFNSDSHVLSNDQRMQKKQKVLFRQLHLLQRVKSVQYKSTTNYKQQDNTKYAEEVVIKQGKKTAYDTAYYTQRFVTLKIKKKKQQMKGRNKYPKTSSSEIYKDKPIYRSENNLLHKQHTDSVSTTLSSRIKQNNQRKSIKVKNISNVDINIKGAVSEKRMKKKWIKKKHKTPSKNNIFFKKSKGIKTILTTVAKGIRKSILSIHNLICIGSAATFLIVLILFIGIFSVLSDESTPDTSTATLSKEVIVYRDIIGKYAEQYDMKQYISLIQAVMMQESGGKGNDPMQASESPYNEKYPKAPNSITDSNYSIEIGIKYLSECLKRAYVSDPSDIERISLALQGYNYGNGYIDWAIKNFGKYTKANAKVFSDEMKFKLKTNAYGDPEYAEHVLRYYHIGDGEFVQIALSQVGNIGGKPYWSWYGYPNRVEWCACFVSWVANEAGFIDQGLVPKFSNCVAGINWFKSHDKWQKKNDLPDTGYIIFFDFNLDGISDHVGIIEYVDNNYIHTIEGNSIDDECRQRVYELSSKYIVGYGKVE